MPGLIQAEDFDNGGEGVAYHDLDAGNNGNQYRSTDVDVRAGQSAANGFAVFNARAGEWLEYTINVAAAGFYDFNVSASSRLAGGSFHLEVDGVDVTGALTVPTTGSWQTFQQAGKNKVSLPAGAHVLRLKLDTNGVEGVCGDFDVIGIAPTTASNLLSPTLVSNAYALATTLANAPTNTGEQIAVLLADIEQAYAAFGSESSNFTTADQMDRGLRASLYFSRAAAALSVEQLSSAGVQSRLQIAAAHLGLVKSLMLPSETASSGAHASVTSAPVIGSADTRSSARFDTTLSPLSLGSILGDAVLSPLATQTKFATPAANGSLPYELSGVCVIIEGRAAQILAVSPSQVNFLVPAGVANGTAEVIVTSDAGYVSRGTVTVATLAPALFAVSGNGAGAGVALNAATNTQGPFNDVTPQNFGTDKRTRLMLMATGISGGGVANTNAGNDIRIGNTVLENFAESVIVEARLQDGRVFQLPVEFAGRQNTWAGLDQINVVLLPELRQAGTVELTLVVGLQRSNMTTISVR
ncbi:MAG TPA: carbohydrate-binding protein [Pyrinomonadaceae bacterium]